MSSNLLSIHDAKVRSFDATSRIATVIMPGPYGMEPIEVAPFMRNGGPLTNTDTLTAGDRVLVVMHDNNVPEWVSTYTDWPATAHKLFVNTTGDVMTGALTLSGPPTVALHAATKAYVDGSVFVPDVYQANSQAAMLALPATKGDYCIRNDVAKTFILQAAPPTVLGNWIELATPDASAAADAAVAAHVALTDPHTQYLRESVAATTYTTVTTFNAHTAAADPHPGYTTPTEVTAQIAADIATHVAAGDPHPVYTTGTELTAAFTAHTGAADPHPVYATDGDLALHIAAADAHPGYLSESEMDAAILAHATAPDPHPVYMTQVESDLLYRNASYLNTGTLSNALLANPITSNTSGTAAAWTTARTLTLAGDLTGSVSIRGDAAMTLSAQVADDSHAHDTQYYTKALADGKYFNKTTGDTVAAGTVSFGSRLGQHIGLNATTYGLGAQTNNTYFRTGAGFRFYLNGVHSDTAGAPGAGGSELLNITTSSVQFKSRNLATEMYVQSRGMNLVANGSGLTGDNTNFSTFSYNSVESFAGGGSFTYNGPDASREIDELIPVDPSRRYKFSYAIKLLSWSTGGEVPNHYGFVDSYDADGLSIQSYHVMKMAGSALTTLAVALNPGNTTITLTSAVGWHNGPTASNKYIAFYPYTNAQGYTYPTYTYTRNVSATDLWAPSGITGNVITLRAPWSGASYPIGTPVANAIAGGTFDYIAGNNVMTPVNWAVFSGSVGKLDSESFNDPNASPVVSSGAYQSPTGFRWGTAFIKVGWLLSYNTPVGTANTAVDAVTFETISSSIDNVVFTGSPPFIITSPTLVPNLNADMVDGLHAAAFLQLTPGGTVVGNVNINPGTLSFGSNLGQRLNLWGSTYAIGVQSSAEYFRTAGDFYWYLNGTHNDAQGNAGGGTSLMSLSNTVFKYKTFDIWHKGNMGSGSTLDADLLDNHDAIYFANRTEMEALLGDLMFVGVYDAAKYDKTTATMPKPIWTGGTSVYRHGMYWVCGSTKELDFIDADYSGRYDAAQTYTVTTKALTSNVATLTTSATHQITAGKEVLIEGVDTVFDGKYVATAPITSTTFSYAKVNTNVSSASVAAGIATLTFDAAVPVASGDWIIALDPFRSAKVAAGNLSADLTLAQVVFQYIPFSTETYVKSVMELHTDPLRSPDPHSQYLLPAEADVFYAPVVHGHEFDINQSLIKHMGFDPWAVTAWSWANGIVTLTVNTDHNLLAGAHFDIAGIHTELNGNQLVQEVDALTRQVRFEHAAQPTGYATPGTTVPVSPAGSVTNDPHSQYLVENEGNALYAFKEHPHSYEAYGAVAFHEGKADPHPQYLTDADALVQYAKIDHNHDLIYAPIVHTHPQVYEIHSTDGAVSADIYVGGTQPTTQKVGDLWIDTVSIAVQVPSTPVNFVASQDYPPPYMKLAWSAWVAAEGVTGVTLSRSTSAAGPWTDIFTGTNAAVTFRDTGAIGGPLLENTNYYWRLFATNPTGSGIANAKVIGPVLSGNTPPTLPTGVVASSPGAGAIRLVWDTVAGLSYEVFQNGTSMGIKTSPYNATGLPENTYYTLGVRAVDAPPVPNLPAYSVIAYGTDVLTPNIPPPVVTGVVVSNITFQGMDVTWNYPAINDLKDFTVTATAVGPGYGYSWTTTGSDFQFNGLDALTNYIITVTARDTGGLIGPAGGTTPPQKATIGANGTTLPPQATLTSFKPQVAYGRMYANFTIPTGVTQYRVDRSTNNVNWTVDLNFTNTTAGAKQQILNASTAFASGTTVYCRVYTKNAAGNTNYIDFDPYTLIATPTYIAADGTNHWRNVNGGQWNGSGNFRPFQGYYDASYPNATGFWFYGTQIKTKLYNGGRRTVTSGKMMFKREACGLATGANPIIQMHPLQVNPGTVNSGALAPTLYGTSSTIAISLTPGGSALQGVLPAAFVTDLVAGISGGNLVYGIAAYDPDGDPYMCFSTVSELPTSGQLQFDHLG